MTVSQRSGRLEELELDLKSFRLRFLAGVQPSCTSDSVDPPNFSVVLCVELDVWTVCVFNAPGETDHPGTANILEGPKYVLGQILIVDRPRFNLKLRVLQSMVPWVQ